MAQFTKKAIKETFMGLLEKRSLDKITVKDIVENCGINRNTFYYYYQDIYALIDDLFEEEKKKVLEDDIKYDTWHEELKRVALFTIGHRKALEHVYYSKSRDVLEKYLFSITDLLIREFVEKQSQEFTISDENKEFICAFYSYSLVGMTLNWLKGESVSDSEEFIKKVAIIFENTVKGAVQSCESMGNLGKME